MMTLLTESQITKLVENGKRQQEADAAGKRVELIPQALLRLPASPPSAWLLASLDPRDPDIAFGSMALAGGQPELGYVRMSELETLRGYQGRGVYHDPHFHRADPRDILSYAEDARMLRQIVLQFTVSSD